jgi:hypothetical protein
MDAVPSKPTSFQQHCAQSCSTHCKHRQLSAHRSTAPQAHCRCDATAPPGLPWAPLPQLSTLPLFLQNHVQNHVNPEGHTRPAHEAKMAAWCAAPSTTHPRQHTKKEGSHVQRCCSHVVSGHIYTYQSVSCCWGSCLSVSISQHDHTQHACVIHTSLHPYVSTGALDTHHDLAMQAKAHGATTAHTHPSASKQHMCTLVLHLSSICAQKVQKQPARQSSHKHTISQSVQDGCGVTHPSLSHHHTSHPG